MHRTLGQALKGQPVTFQGYGTEMNQREWDGSL